MTKRAVALKVIELQRKLDEVNATIRMMTNQLSTLPLSKRESYEARILLLKQERNRMQAELAKLLGG
jgi:hypothetical protein